MSRQGNSLWVLGGRFVSMHVFPRKDRCVVAKDQMKNSFPGLADISSCDVVHHKNATATAIPTPPPAPSRAPSPTDPTGTTTTAATAATTSGTDPESGALAGMTAAHNAKRCLHGAPALVWDAKLAAVAQAHADSMCAAGALSHSTSDWRTKKYGSSGWLGENIAMGYSEVSKVYLESFRKVFS